MLSSYGYAMLLKHPDSDYMHKQRVINKKWKPEMYIVIFLSDWCPECLEYKVVLNRVLLKKPYNIVFMPQSEFNISNEDISIPYTVLIKGQPLENKNRFISYEQFLAETKVKHIKTQTGIMTYDQFLLECKGFCDE